MDAFQNMSLEAQKALQYITEKQQAMEWTKGGWKSLNDIHYHVTQSYNHPEWKAILSLSLSLLLIQSACSGSIWGSSLSM